MLNKFRQDGRAGPRTQEHYFIPAPPEKAPVYSPAPSPLQLVLSSQSPKDFKSHFKNLPYMMASCLWIHIKNGAALEKASQAADLSCDFKFRS